MIQDRADGTEGGPIEAKMWIAGEWVSASQGRTTPVLDPSDGRVLGHAPHASPEDVKHAVDVAREAFDRGPWPRWKPKDRAEVLRRAAQLLTERAEALAQLESRNAGKPIRQATFFDLALAPEHLSYFGDLAARPQKRRVAQPDLEGSEGTIVREPVGVCVGIAPWNLPLLMAVWKVGPALAAGNTVILKPSVLTPFTSLELARILDEAGLPKGTLQVVTGPGADVGNLLVSDPRVDLVSFTGSTSVGREVLARSAGTIKRTLLELGGKSANLILPDADLGRATDGAVFGIFLHAGQLCESGSRLLVPARQRDRVIQLLLEKTHRLRVGLPRSFSTDVGPLISEEQRRRVEDYIHAGVADGAKLLAGGQRPDTPELRRGFYLRPTIFADVTPSMRIAREEVFGPVLSVLTYESVDEAVDIANGTEYGLAAAVWSENVSKARRVADRLRAGTVWINSYHLLSCHAPRGGFKQSGIGRELGPEALDEFSEVKHVFRDPDGRWASTAYPLLFEDADGPTPDSPGNRPAPAAKEGEGAAPRGSPESSGNRDPLTRSNAGS